MKGREGESISMATVEVRVCRNGEESMEGEG